MKAFIERPIFNIYGINKIFHAFFPYEQWIIIVVLVYKLIYTDLKWPN